MGFRLPATIGLALLAAVAATAQSPPADPTVMPPVPTSYAPRKTSWGDPDLTGIFPLEHIDQSRIPLSRPERFGNRFWVTEAEFAERLAAAQKSDAAFSVELNGRGTQGLARWMETSAFARRTSMIVDPPDGKLPALTPQAKALQDAGRSSWRNGQSYETLYDFDTFDRCVSRGMPASMFPFHYNNGVRIFQSPGYVVIVFEMLGQRIIPLGDAPRWPATMQGWLGDSHGHWEGNTLVVETANIRAGNNSAHDYTQRAASVLHMATNGAPPYNSIPVSKAAHATERFTLTGPDTLSYQIRYSDPAVFTAPWTARLDWTRKSDYEFFEYACHEGNNQLRGRITAWKAQQAQERASGAGGGAQ